MQLDLMSAIQFEISTFSIYIQGTIQVVGPNSSTGNPHRCYYIDLDCSWILLFLENAYTAVLISPFYSCLFSFGKWFCFSLMQQHRFLFRSVFSSTLWVYSIFILHDKTSYHSLLWLYPPPQIFQILVWTFSFLLLQL